MLLHFETHWLLLWVTTWTIPRCRTRQRIWSGRIWHLIKPMGMRAWRFTVQHFVARLAFAREHQNCQVHQWCHFGSGSVMVWREISLESHTDLHVLANGALTTVWYQDEIFRAAVGIDWPSCSPDLNVNENLCYVMYWSIQSRSVAPQAVQVLTDALI